MRSDCENCAISSAGERMRVGGLVHCRACDRSARGRGGCDRRPLRICWRMGESGEAVLSICRVPFGVGARGQAAERVVSRGRAKRGGSDAACLAGKGQPGPADGSTRPPGPQSPGPEGATFPCSVSQKPVSFAPLRGNAAEAGLKLKFSIPAFDTGFESVHNLKFSAGGVPEWLKGQTVNLLALRLRWFESNLLHQRPYT